MVKKDENQIAFSAVQELIKRDAERDGIIFPEGISAKSASKHVKNLVAVESGRLGGKKGGVARAAKLTGKKRSEIARKAAKTRWKNNK